MKQQILADERELFSTTILSPEELAQAAAPAAKSTLVDHAYQDFCTRRETGEILDPDEYCERYPSLKSSLHRLIQAHLFLEENPFLIGEPIPPHWPEPREGYLGFHLVHELGRGTFARVFLAKEPKLGDRYVAVKIAQHGGAEAKILGRIEHPNIVPVFSVQEDVATGMTVVCMPYLGRATLCDVLDSIDADTVTSSQASKILQAVEDDSQALEVAGRRPEAARILRTGDYVDGIRSIGAQLAEALAYIHQRGICHRDLKPSNVLMSPEGVPMLLDFNLSADVKLATNRVGGTFPYMPPEQLRPLVDQGSFDPATLDGRSDIFSLGVILYQLLTGKHPFGPLPLKSPSAELCAHLLERQQKGPVPICELNPRVDRTFSQMVQRCLAFDPKDRPATAGELARILRLGLAPLGRVRRWLAQHPRTLIAASLLVLTTSSSAAVVAYNRAPYSERQAHAAAVEFKQGNYAGALQLIDNAIASDKENAQLRVARGQVNIKLGASDKAKYKLAIEDFEGADLLAPAGTNAAAIGYCLNRLGGNEHAGARYLDAIKAGCVTAEVYNNLGYSDLNGRPADKARQSSAKDHLDVMILKAKANFDLAISLNPDLKAAYHNRAMIALHQARAKLALLDLWALAKAERQTHFLGLATSIAADARAILLLGPKMQEIKDAEKMEEKIRGELWQCLKPGIDDVEAALRKGAPSAELHYDAACIYAAAARLGPQWADRVLAQLTAAIENGADPRKLARESLFHFLKDNARFQALQQRPASDAPAAATQRIVNPLQDFPG